MLVTYSAEIKLTQLAQTLEKQKMPNVTHGSGESDRCFYGIVKDTGTLPKIITQALLGFSRTGRFPYSSNSELSASIPLKENRRRGPCITCSVTRQETSRLTLGPGRSSLHTPHSSGLHMHHHSPEMDDDVKQC